MSLSTPQLILAAAPQFKKLAEGKVRVTRTWKLNKETDMRPVALDALIWQPWGTQDGFVSGSTGAVATSPPVAPTIPIERPDDPLGNAYLVEQGTFADDNGRCYAKKVYEQTPYTLETGRSTSGTVTSTRYRRVFYDGQDGIPKPEDLSAFTPPTGYLIGAVGVSKETDSGRVVVEWDAATVVGSGEISRSFSRDYLQSGGTWGKETIRVTLIAQGTLNSDGSYSPPSTVPTPTGIGSDYVLTGGGKELRQQNGIFGYEYTYERTGDGDVSADRDKLAKGIYRKTKTYATTTFPTDTALNTSYPNGWTRSHAASGWVVSAKENVSIDTSVFGEVSRTVTQDMRQHVPTGAEGDTEESWGKTTVRVTKRVKSTSMPTGATVEDLDSSGYVRVTRGTNEEFTQLADDIWQCDFVYEKLWDDTFAAVQKDFIHMGVWVTMVTKNYGQSFPDDYTLDQLTADAGSEWTRSYEDSGWVVRYPSAITLDWNEVRDESSVRSREDGSVVETVKRIRQWDGYPPNIWSAPGTSISYGTILVAFSFSYQKYKLCFLEATWIQLPQGSYEYKMVEWRRPGIFIPNIGGDGVNSAFIASSMLQVSAAVSTQYISYAPFPNTGSTWNITHPLTIFWSCVVADENNLPIGTKSHNESHSWYISATNGTLVGQTTQGEELKFMGMNVRSYSMTWISSPNSLPMAGTVLAEEIHKYAYDLYNNQQYYVQRTTTLYQDIEFPSVEYPEPEESGSGS
ncbi:MAG: hypothetical protein LBT00_13305 [Spirochaetaceae bacterium]|jgi:hypothetical protein|nr:hypothetical protein [Spirochaetaceae bacterium]